MNLLKLLFESIVEKVTQKPLLGSGNSKEVYASVTKPDYVIKKWNPEDDDKVEKEVEISNNNPDVVAEIIKYDPERRIIIQKRLNTDKVKKDMEKLLFTKKGYLVNADTVFDNLWANYTNKKHFKSRLSQYISLITNKTFKDQDPESVSIYKKWIQFFEDVDDKMDSQTIDWHMGNVGYDSDGRIKLLDV